MARSKAKGQGHQEQKRKNCCVIPTDNALLGVHHAPYAANDVSREVTGVHADGGMLVVYAWKNIFALLFHYFFLFVVPCGRLMACLHGAIVAAIGRATDRRDDRTV